jgi:NADPH2:quinone reductase
LKTIVVSKLGGPDVLTVEERSIPQIGAKEVVIKVSATSVNFADNMIVSKRYPLVKAAEAQAYVESRKSTGKVLLIP